MDLNTLKEFLDYTLEYRENNNLPPAQAYMISKEIHNVLNILDGKSSVKSYCKPCAELQLNFLSNSSYMDLFFQFTKVSPSVINVAWWFEGSEDQTVYHQLDGDFITDTFLFTFIGNVIEELIAAGMKMAFACTLHITTTNLIRSEANDKSND